MTSFFPQYPKFKGGEDIEFEVVDWRTSDLKDDTLFDNDQAEQSNDKQYDSDEYSSDDNYKPKSEKIKDWREPCENYNGYQFVCKAYGRTMDGRSVSVHITGFRPHFYIPIPNGWTDGMMNRFIDTVLNNMSKPWMKNGFSHWKTVRYETLYWFDNYKKHPFAMLIFYSNGTLREFMNTLNNTRKNSDGIIDPDNPHLFDFAGFSESITPTYFKRNKYYSNLPPMLSCFHFMGIKPCGWIQISKDNYNIASKDLTHCDIDIIAHYKDVHDLETTNISPMRILSFDIECQSATHEEDEKHFPDSCVARDLITQIGSTVHIHGETDCCIRYISVIRDCEAICAEGTDDYKIAIETNDHKQIVSDNGTCKTVIDISYNEKNMILRWGEFFQAISPDIVTGYNIWGFDWEYINNRITRAYYTDEEKRARTSYSDELCSLMSKNIKSKAWYRKQKLASSAMGQNYLEYFEIEGVCQIDLYKLFQTTEKLQKYSLNFVSNEFLNQSKVDLPAREIFRYYDIGTPDKIKQIAIYCIQDCRLCNLLLIKKNVITNNMGMGNVCLVPLQFLFTRGQGIKIFSLMSNECREEGMLIRDITNDRRDTSGYEGAIVFKPKPDIYYSPAVVLDYASLYPSSMIAENISHDSLVTVEVYLFEYSDDTDQLEYKLSDILGNKEYLNLPDFLYNVIEYDLYENKAIVLDKGLEFKPLINDYGDVHKEKVIIGKKICTYAEHRDCVDETAFQRKGDMTKKALLPRVEMKVLKARKSTRAKIPQIYMEYRITENNTTKNEIIEYEITEDGEIKDDENISEDITKVEKALIVIQKIDEDNKEEVDKSEDYYKIKFVDSGKTEWILKSCVIEFVDRYTQFQKDVFDGLQLAYKVVANSLYGQAGGTTSAICLKEVAACTTATGRAMVLLARDLILDKYAIRDQLNIVKEKSSELVYGDTDSVFMNFENYIRALDPNPEKLTAYDILVKSIELGIISGKYVNNQLKHPQELEYEKTFYPFVIFSKKRYFGQLYELNPNKCKPKSMGIILKRRDNIPYAREIYGGIIDIILSNSEKGTAIREAKKYYISGINKLLRGDIDIEKLLMNKTLGDDYADPTTAAQKVLAMRIELRTPGLAPQVNDRVDYGFIDDKYYKCKVCNGAVDSKNCKCPKCIEMYCKDHLKHHTAYCTENCRFCRNYNELDFFTCKTCTANYCVYCKKSDRCKKCKAVKSMLEKALQKYNKIDKKNAHNVLGNKDASRLLQDMMNCDQLCEKSCFRKHQRKNNKKLRRITYDKCKKVVSKKLLQGDLIESPDFIKENNIPMNYKYIFETQVKKPTLQLFDLAIDNSEAMIEAVMIQYSSQNRKERKITGFFKPSKPKPVVTDEEFKKHGEFEFEEEIDICSEHDSEHNSDVIDMLDEIE